MLASTRDLAARSCPSLSLMAAFEGLDLRLGPR